jgi:hypothetical protein
VRKFSLSSARCLTFFEARKAECEDGSGHAISRAVYRTTKYADRIIEHDGDVDTLPKTLDDPNVPNDTNRDLDD